MLPQTEEQLREYYQKRKFSCLRFNHIYGPQALLKVHQTNHVVFSNYSQSGAALFHAEQRCHSAEKTTRVIGFILSEGKLYSKCPCENGPEVLS